MIMQPEWYYVAMALCGEGEFMGGFVYFENGMVRVMLYGDWGFDELMPFPYF